MSEEKTRDFAAETAAKAITIDGALVRMLTIQSPDYEGRKCADCEHARRHAYRIRRAYAAGVRAGLRHAE